MSKSNENVEFDNLDPMGEFSRRSASEVYAEKRRKRHRMQKIVLGVVASVLTVVVIIVSAVALYINVLQGRLGQHGDITNELKGQLTERKAPQDPFYVLLLGTDGRPGETNYRSDTILLARLDPKDKKITIISIPRDIPVKIPGHGRQKINAAHAFGGPRLAVQTISKFCGVPITHYVEVSFDGFKEVVDALGGIEVDVPKKVDDPNVHQEVIEPGRQVLNGNKALVFCRSRDYRDGDFTRMRNQRLFLTALADKVLNKSDAVEMVKTVDSLSKMVLTDMSVTEIVGLIHDFSGMNPKDIMTGVVPSDAMMAKGVSYVVPFLEEWKEMMKRVDQGLPPQADKSEVIAKAEEANQRHLTRQIEKDPANGKYQVTIKNGARLKGAASAASDLVKRAGYSVNKVGDIDNMVYDKTLVIYRSKEKEKVAKDICELLGVGEPVKDTGKYKFNGDILVIVGTDWARS